MAKLQIMRVRAKTCDNCGTSYSVQFRAECKQFLCYTCYNTALSGNDDEDFITRLYEEEGEQ